MIMENKNIIWMPVKDYLLYKEMMDKMDVEAINRMRYYFWNNFSDKGYDEWKNNSTKENEK